MIHEILQTHKHYLESRYKELNTRIEIYNKVLAEMTEDKTKLENLITNIDNIMSEHESACIRAREICENT